MKDTERQPRTLGRLPADQRAAREQAILDHALDELVEHGVQRLSMSGIAQRAGASKETLYAWFGDRDGLLEALIRRNADETAERVRKAIDAGGDLRATLIDFGTGLLTLLTSEPSVTLNRAAMMSPDLARLLLRSGRHRVGPIVERFLGACDPADTILSRDPRKAFELLYGLIIQDSQIRVLLGEARPGRTAIKRRVELAVDRFLLLCQREDLQ